MNDEYPEYPGDQFPVIEGNIIGKCSEEDIIRYEDEYDGK